MKDMKRSFSIQTKLQFLLILIPVLCLGTFATVALKEFFSDRKTFVLDSSLNSVQLLESSLSSKIDFLLGRAEGLVKTKGLEKDKADFFVNNLGVNHYCVFRELDSNLEKDKKLEVLNGLSFQGANDAIQHCYADENFIREQILQKSNRVLFAKASKSGELFLVVHLGKTALVKMDTIHFFQLNTATFFEGFNRNRYAQTALLSRQGQIIYSGTEQFQNKFQDVFKYLQRSFQVNQIAKASFEYSFGKEENLVAYATNKNAENLIIQTTSLEAVTEAVRIILVKSGVLLLIIILSVILMGRVFARKITGPIHELYLSALEVEKGNFSVRPVVRAQDEVGVLAFQFGKMTSEISKLLSDLEQHNKNLEKIVSDRTRELKEVNLLQIALLDSLNEGFAVISPVGIVRSVFSKAAARMLPSLREGISFWALLGLSKKEEAELVQLSQLLSEGTLSFNDFKQLGVATIQTSSERNLRLQYYPIVNEKDELTSFAAVIIDETDQLLQQVELSRQKNKVEQALRINANKFHAVFVVLGTRELLQNAKLILEKKDRTQLRNLLLNVHTAKGNVLLFQFSEVAEAAHELETVISSLMEENRFDHEILSRGLQKFSTAFENSILENISFLGAENVNRNIQIEISISKFTKLLSDLDSKLDHRFFAEFQEFYVAALSKPAKSYLSFLEQIATETARDLGKKVHFQFENSDFVFFGQPYGELFMSLAHAIRNSIYHGIESPSERSAKGKPEVGELKMFVGFEQNDQKKLLKISISDDGQGLQRDAVLKKLISAKAERQREYAVLGDDELANLFFRQGLSTAAAVSMVAGRGAGNEAIIHTVESIGGSVQWKVLKPGLSMEVKVPYQPQFS